MTLDGWKAIAEHLAGLGCPGRNERTMRRWVTADDPLPIYTTPGGRAVLCESDELERWWRRVSRRRTRRIEQAG